MNLLIWNSTDFWVPTFLFNDTSYHIWNYFPLFFTFFFLLFLSACLIICSIIVMNNIRKLHTNATWILIITCGGWFEGMIGILMILPYRYGLVNLADPSKVYFGLETDELLPVELSCKSFPLIIASIFIWHYLGILNGGIIMFVVERSIATLLLKDYEQTSRNWIFIALMISHHIYAIGFCIFSCFHLLPLKILLFLNVLGFLTCVPYVFYLRHYNVSARNRLRLGANITKNSLTAKFQTEENVRAMNIATCLATVAAVFDVLFIIVILLATLKVTNTVVFFYATEMLLFFNPLFIVPCVLSVVDDWRKKFFEYLPITRLRIDPNHNPYVAQAVQPSDLHFIQLRSLWT